MINIILICDSTIRKHIWGLSIDSKTLQTSSCFKNISSGNSQGHIKGNNQIKRGNNLAISSTENHTPCSYQLAIDLYSSFHIAFFNLWIIKSNSISQ